MTITTLQKVAVAPAVGLATPAAAMQDAYALPLEGLTARFRFTEANLASGVKDDISDAFYVMWGAAVGGSESESMLAGGGLRISGWRAVRANLIDPSLPFTIGIVMTAAAPASKAVSGRSCLAVKDITQISGFSHFIQQGGAVQDEIRTGAEYGLYTDVTVDGVGALLGSRTASTRPLAATFDHPAAIIVRHEGGGRLNVIMTDGESFSTHGIQMDATKLKGPTGTAACQLLIGGSTDNPNLRNGLLTYDLACTWNRAISDDAVRQFTTGGLALAASRGRT